MYPASSSISIPNFLNPFKCKSIGLDPISHPPGYENVAFLNRPIIAPAKTTDDLICLIKSSGILCSSILLESITILPFFLYILQPKISNIFKVIWVSCILGTLYNFVIFLFNMLAAIIGKEAFFEPETSTSPSSLLPPSIM